eukprot:Rmarinus@m.22242
MKYLTWIKKTKNHRQRQKKPLRSSLSAKSSLKSGQSRRRSSVSFAPSPSPDAKADTVVSEQLRTPRKSLSFENVAESDGELSDDDLDHLGSVHLAPAEWEEEAFGTRHSEQGRQSRRGRSPSHPIIPSEQPSKGKRGRSGEKGESGAPRRKDSSSSPARIQTPPTAKKAKPSPSGSATSEKVTDRISRGRKSSARAYNDEESASSGSPHPTKAGAETGHASDASAGVGQDMCGSSAVMDEGFDADDGDMFDFGIDSSVHMDDVDDDVTHVPCDNTDPAYEDSESFGEGVRKRGHQESPGDNERQKGKRRKLRKLGSTDVASPTLSNSATPSSKRARRGHLAALKEKRRRNIPAEEFKTPRYQGRIPENMATPGGEHRRESIALLGEYMHSNDHKTPGRRRSSRRRLRPLQWWANEYVEYGPKADEEYCNPVVGVHRPTAGVAPRRPKRSAATAPRRLDADLEAVSG